ncbi:MAG TPA: tetratricopeptide repeat protein [Pyrinomonadaceae bacterium]|nr:tetratricopeptide repeat protein [Pyrinomonadaceae bacterium]
MVCPKRFILRLSLTLTGLAAAATGVHGLPGVARASAPPAQAAAAQQRAAALVAAGIAALERDDPAAAKASFERALELDRRNVDAHTYLGVLADRAGQLAEAERHFAAAAINAPLSAPARNNHGAILLRLGRTEQAATQFEVSLKLAPDQPSALVNLAQINFAAGTPEKLARARALFARAQQVAPDAAIARSLVVVALRLNDAAAAKNYYRDYKSLAASANLSPAATDAPPADAALGTALLAAGLADEAAAELEAALALAPSDTGTIVQLARAQLARGDLPAAGRTLEGAVARGLDAAPVLSELAEVYVRSNHIEHAIPAMRLAIERDGGKEEYYFRYAMMLTETGAPAAAIIRLNEALEKFPRSARLRFALGLAQFKSNKNDEAARALTHVISLDPKFAPALAYLGMTYVELGRYDEAVKFYEQTLALDPHLGIVNYLAAEALLKQNPADMPRIEAHLVRAVKADDSFAPARLALAKVYLRGERLPEAVAELERAVARDPNLAEAYYQLGRVYGRLKRTAEAQAALANFKRLNEAHKEQSQKERQEIARRLANVRF